MATFSRYTVDQTSQAMCPELQTCPRSWWWCETASYMHSVSTRCCLCIKCPLAWINSSSYTFNVFSLRDINSNHLLWNNVNRPLTVTCSSVRAASWGEASGFSMNCDIWNSLTTSTNRTWSLIQWHQPDLIKYCRLSFKVITFELWLYLL